MNFKKNKFNILIACVFSIVAITLSLMLDYQRLSNDFKDDISPINYTFIQNITSVKNVLVSLAGLHHASDNLNEAELSSFSAEMLKTYPFINSIIGLEKVDINDERKFELKMHNQGYVNLKIKSADKNNHSTKNNFYLPIDFIEPMTPFSASMLGLDIYSLPYMPDVIDLSINSGNIVSSKISKFVNFKKPYLFIFKSLYLGRYPPTSKDERHAMFDGIVALKIDINHFINSLKLERLNLTGKIKNINTSAFFKNNQKTIEYKTSLKQLKFIEKFRIYDQNYQFTLQREITAGMLNKTNMFLFWVTSMLLFIFLHTIHTKRKASKNEIEFLAYFDPLTNLPNRSSFKESLNLAITEAAENDTMGAVLFMDIDEFKRINDTLGHDSGDELLKQISKAMAQHMRQGDTFDPTNRFKTRDIVSRLGGDEFTVLLTDIKDVNSVAIVANRILQHISQAFYLNGHEVHITSSIGIAFFPQDGNDVDKLLKNADTAMYHAKDTGKNNYQFYKQNMSFKIEKRLELEEKLHKALTNKEFQIYYQPQIDAKTNKIIAAEALLRWNQSDIGMVLPADFIPLAEETGQIVKIGKWVIHEACRQNKAWQIAGYDPIRVAVNLSGLQFLDSDLCENIKHALNKSQLNPKHLELEITESIMMRNTEHTISIIKNFTDMNIEVSIDDFGTGYSSLSYLKKFPLNSLKIDRSFVQDIPDNKDDMMITSAIISMAKSLHLKVIAEGVETEEQIAFLKERDCDMLQGYYFSRPVPADEFEKMLTRKN